MPAAPDARDAYRAPYGTHDVLAPESDRWQELVARFADRARRFGYGLVLTPVFEHAEVFHRVGATSDIVTKELYEFEDRGGRRLALRPEGTASVVRAFVQHRPPVPWKCWYLAPNFRAERPQKGRYRQHWQLGAEVLGVDDPDVDVEVIALFAGFLSEVGLQRARLLINTMGDDETIMRYFDALRQHYSGYATLLGDEDRERAERNPARLLDSKRKDLWELLDTAPPIFDYLSDASAASFERVRSGLRSLGIDHEIDKTIVRGLDYYTGTTFEVRHDGLGAQSALGGGGRYDRLAEEMGGPRTPSIGFGTGIERILLACDAEGVLPVAASRVDVFVVDLLGTEDATVLLHELRERGVACDRAYGGRSGKKQWAAADKSGARYGVMLAPREAEAGLVAVKDLGSGEQVEVKRAEIADWLLSHTRKEREHS